MGRWGEESTCQPLCPLSPCPSGQHRSQRCLKVCTTDGEINQTKIASPSCGFHTTQVVAWERAPVRHNVLTEELSILWAIDHSIHSRFQTSFR